MKKLVYILSLILLVIISVGVFINTVSENKTEKRKISEEQSKIKEKPAPNPALEDLKRGKRGESVVHPPWARNQCVSCHRQVEVNPADLIKPEKELCYSCHFFDESFAAHGHPPFDRGMCTDCHNPHRSKEDALLLQKSPNLCLECHSKQKEKAPAIHNRKGHQQCLSCHHPHASNQPFFLVKPKANLCKQCHN